MSDDNLAKAPRALWHLPTVAGADVITYNLPGDPKLKLDGPTIAGIFLGKVVKWNDPAIAGAEPGRQAARRGHRRRPSLGRQRHDLHLHGLPEQREPGLEGQGRQGYLGQLADRHRRQGQRGRRRAR